MPGHFPESLDSLLTHSDGAGRLIAHAKLLQKLSRIYRNGVPEHLGAASRVANYKSGTVVIHADNGAVAVKLRQMAPRLANEFSSRGVECNGVTVKVQALEISRHSSEIPVRPLPTTASQALGRLADEMRPSPLREAIETLLRRSLKEE